MRVRARYILLTGIFTASAVISVFFILRYWHNIANLPSYGYLGVLIVAFIAGCSIPTPIPYLLLIFTFGGILNPALVGLVGGVGAGTGGTLVYILGRGGHQLLPGLQRFLTGQTSASKSVARFFDLARRRGSVVVFLMSALPNPIFAPLALVMGALRFHLVRFFLLCVAGNIVKAVVISYAGYIGIGALLHWLGG